MFYFSLQNIDNDFALLPFVKNSTIFEAHDVPKAFISLKNAGSMRFRWNEKNDVREAFFSKNGIDKQRIVPIELIHSKKVFDVKNSSDILNLCGDGIITNNNQLLPSVTVADCMPIYLFDTQKKVFGVVHSGWKGTGIILEALHLAQKNYNCLMEDFLIIFGPHIRSCCYKIDEARKNFFVTEFLAESVFEKIIDNQAEYYLSLEQANYFILKQAGINEENISICTNCTCCSSFLGSFRRETMHLPSTASIEERWMNFTPQSAFIGYV
ncbi:MAG: polyphenol oxidase family protein [Treponemataceae bacterium]